MSGATISRKSRSVRFLEEPVPEYGKAVEVAPGIRRIVARNPGVMTYHGTNTFLLEGEGGADVIDPGPDDSDHVAAIIAATSGRIARIWVSHGHGDHIGAALELKQKTGGLLLAPGLPPSANMLTPDIAIEEGLSRSGITAIATPGHTLDHFCFLRESDRSLFTADHVMTWSSSIVSPKWGQMGAFFTSLQRLIDRADPLCLPGHGPNMPDPVPFYRQLMDLRLRREEAVIAAMRNGSSDVAAMARRIYPHLSDPKSIWAAEQNLIAHLEKLEEDGRVLPSEDESWKLLDR